MHDIKKSFYINGFTLSLALKQKLDATRKWSIMNMLDSFAGKATNNIIALVKV